MALSLRGSVFHQAKSGHVSHFELVGLYLYGRCFARIITKNAAQNLRGCKQRKAQRFLEPFPLGLAVFAPFYMLYSTLFGRGVSVCSGRLCGCLCGQTLPSPVALKAAREERIFLQNSVYCILLRIQKTVLASICSEFAPHRQKIIPRPIRVNTNGFHIEI